MLLSSSVIKNTRTSEKNKEIITDSSVELKQQSLGDMADILKQSDNEIFEGVEKIANTIIENAKKSAEDLRERSIEEAKKIQQDAYEEGFSKGKQEGYNKAYEETVEKGKIEIENYKSLAEANASNMMISAKFNYEKYVIEKQEEIKKLAISIASHILKREVLSDEGINDMIYSAVEDSKNSELTVIKCNQVHYKAILDATILWKQKLPVSGEIFVIEDNYIDEGQALIEKNNGKVKVGIDIGLEKIKEELLKSDL
ncbi:flagellar assembly protein FliH [Clostridium acidisoli DSM 12555]|uniref:Flagellar assembly protein FliH n=1 Tax=Clostridium acidisoli DSM 12555 TaxID=1121291 RepID=A0A1W1X1Q2_9CLOT|nr:flagellar assembly protein FliH [Clostridium acidisoli]SMC17872.1 flagellar assembly protein FliH [Clostridium acidisoli DSM 12555]